jgi:hypothetical protein
MPGGTVKADGEEVEKTAMDVQADQTGLQAEHATIVFERPGSPDRDRPAADPRGTHYADTDQIPVVPRHYRPRRPDRGAHALRIAVASVAVVVLLAAAMLGLVSSGVINLSSTAPPHKAAVHTPTTFPSDTTVLTQISAGPVSASYSIPVTAYAVTVSTTVERSWVSIAPAGQRPAYEGVLNPGQSQHEIILGPSTIEVGAGGTTVTVTSGKHSQLLKPPAAPFSYQITPKT